MFTIYLANKMINNVISNNKTASPSLNQLMSNPKMTEK